MYKPTQINKMKRNFFKLLIVAFLIVAGIYVTMEYFSPREQSVEGALLADACEDIQSFESFRAEQELDSLIEIIMHHKFPTGSGSNWTEAEILMDLRKIKDEIAFQNKDMDMYHRQFALILNKLAYAHLQDAKAFLENNSTAAAKESLNEACHFVHDALFFSKGEIITEQRELLQKMKTMTEQDVNLQKINECMTMTI
jgi:hypothetical protein